MSMNVTPVVPDPAMIAAAIQAEGGNLVDSFLAVLPETLKEPQHEARVVKLFHDVKRAMRVPKRASYEDAREHWALL